MFDFMCKNKDAIKKGMKDMLQCNMGKMVQEYQKMNPDDKEPGPKTWAKVQSCYPKRPKPQGSSPPPQAQPPPKE